MIRNCARRRPKQLRNLVWVTEPARLFFRRHRLRRWLRRRRLRRNIDILADELSIQPTSAIVPWIIGDEKATLAAARNLQDNGFLVPAIRYPTVAKGEARLRITLSAAHEATQLRSLAGAKRLPKRD
jgi:7-keto-8-aminopelargonate synthetase-like enzyme